MNMFFLFNFSFSLVTYTQQILRVREDVYIKLGLVLILSDLESTKKKMSTKTEPSDVSLIGFNCIKNAL